MANVEQGSQITAEPRKSSTERGRGWRENNRDKYNAYMRNYNKETGKARQGSKRRYHENIDEARKQSSERVRRFREKQKQQQSGEIFPQTGQ